MPATRNVIKSTLVRAGSIALVLAAAVFAYSASPTGAAPLLDPQQFEKADVEELYTVASEVYTNAPFAGDDEAGRAAWSNAAQFWRLFLTKAPTDARVPLATYYLGVCLRESGDAREAIRQFQAAGGLQGKEGVRLKIDLGTLLHQQYRRDGNEQTYAECLAAFEEAKRLSAPNPLSPEGRFNLALARREQYQKGGTITANAAQQVVELLDDLTFVTLDSVVEYVAANVWPEGTNPWRLALQTSRLTSSGEEQKNARIVFLRAEAWNTLEDYKKAAAEYARFRNAYPGHEWAVHAAYAEGQCRFLLKEYDRAEDVFRPLAVSGASPGLQAEAMFALAEALYGQAKYPEAEKWFERCSEQSSPRVDLARLRGAECLAKQEQWVRAANKARKLVNGPLAARARLLAADCYVLAGDFQAALDVISPTDRPRQEPLTPQEREVKGQAAYGKAEKHFRENELLLAAQQFEELAADLDDAQLRLRALHNAGQCWFRLNEWQKACDTFSRQLTLGDESSLAAETYFRQGLAFLELKDKDHARTALAESVKRARAAKDPEFVAKALRRAGAVAEKSGQVEEAERYYQQLVADEASSTFPELRVEGQEGLARMALRRRAYAEAGEHLLASLPSRDRKETARICFLAARCYETAGQLDKALNVYQRASENNGPDEWLAKALLGCARCHEALGQHDRALDVWYDLASRLPDQPEAVEAERRVGEDVANRLKATSRR